MRVVLCPVFILERGEGEFSRVFWNGSNSISPYRKFSAKISCSLVFLIQGSNVTYLILLKLSFKGKIERSFLALLFTFIFTFCLGLLNLTFCFYLEDKTVSILWLVLSFLYSVVNLLSSMSTLENVSMGC